MADVITFKIFMDYVDIMFKFSDKLPSKIMQPPVYLWHYGTMYMYVCGHLLWLKFSKFVLWDCVIGLSTALSDKCYLIY